MNAVQKRFAEEHGMPVAEVARLVRLATRAGKCNEHYSNGDPTALRHTGEMVMDKATASKIWNAKVDELTEQIAELVRPYGFTEVVYIGLGPTLKRGDRFVEVPY